MPTIQIADKPTLDEVHAKVESLAQGYSEPQHGVLNVTGGQTVKWTCPQGITTAYVMVITAGGGGGGGGGASGSKTNWQKGGGAGGNGGYQQLISFVWKVDAGTEYTIKCGLGGAGGAGGANNTDDAGTYGQNGSYGEDGGDCVVGSFTFHGSQGGAGGLGGATSGGTGGKGGLQYADYIGNGNESKLYGSDVLLSMNTTSTQQGLSVASTSSTGASRNSDYRITGIGLYAVSGGAGGTYGGASGEDGANGKDGKITILW